ncbi:MAG TPA: hypothetical protein H9867_09765 [Candidatus Corynebacterium gallistercoris]|uniref:Uncharacterized protein n=1 Tax=Candidatus Corynebacterium gallistercoris TaxID=2838530 RepID=A0A9D1S038_9CORY|nr:hypothetical protein [Candidatus Corynebacterium gallistercoris]
MQSFTLPHNGSDATAIARRLNTMPGYKEFATGSEQAEVRVGREALMRLIGVYVYSNYTAPVRVSVQRNNQEAVVTLSDPSVMISTDKVQDFFAKTHAEIKSRIIANA